MCQKLNLTKRFFVLLNHPAPLQKAIPIGLVKNTPTAQSLYELSRNSLFLSDKQVKELGVNPPKALQAYLIPIDIPRDWFIH